MKKIIALFTLCLSLNLYSAEWGAFLGLNYTEFESNVSWDHKSGFELGSAFHHLFTNNLAVRTGLGYVQKNSAFRSGTSSADFQISYIEIPATILYKTFGDAGLIFGANLDLLLSDSCTGASCSALELEDFVMNGVFGANFRTPGNEWVEVLLEFTGLSDIFNGTAIGSSLSVRYVYMF